MSPQESQKTTLLQKLCIAGIRTYLVVSRLSHPLTASLFPSNACRFSPTCSEYAIQAVARHGLPLGLKITLKRLLRCHPGSPGGLDPVPF